MSVDITVNTNVRVVDLSVTFDGNTVNLQPTLTIGGSSGGAVWGGITGTLSDQTDLQNALDLKANTADIPTNTSDLVNDGSDGVNPFITAADVSVPTLQQVTDKGNVTTRDIRTNGKYLIGDYTEIRSGAINTILQTSFPSSGAQSIIRAINSSNGNLSELIVFSNGIRLNVLNKICDLNLDLLTSPRVVSFQDKDGTLAMLDDIPASAVDSVNGKTGVVVLDADDIDDSTTTNKFATAAQLSQIATNESDITDLQNDKQNKIGTTSYATLTGAVNVDVSALADDVYYVLTGNTTITWTNTPTLGQSFIRSFIIKSTTAETLTLPAADISKGTYANDGSENQITVKFSNFATEGLKIVQFINNA